MRKAKPANPRLKDPEQEEVQRPPVLTGSDPIDRALRGGIPLGTLTLVEGPSGSGKSVLSQHLAYGALLSDLRVGYYVESGTARELLVQMESLGLEEVAAYGKDKRFLVTPLSALPSIKRSRNTLVPLLLHLRNQIEQLDLVIIDSLTKPVLHASDSETIDFLEACKEMCENGATIMVTLHSSAFDEDLLWRLHRIFDAHIHLDVHGYTYGLQMKEMNLMKIEKVRNGEVTQKSTLFFEVDPTLGVSMNISIKVLPLFRLKA